MVSARARLNSFRSRARREASSGNDKEEKMKRHATSRKERKRERQKDRETEDRKGQRRGEQVEGAVEVVALRREGKQKKATCCSEGEEGRTIGG